MIEDKSDHFHTSKVAPSSSPAQTNLELSVLFVSNRQAPFFMTP